MTYTLRPGMEVRACDGRKIGTISRLFSAAPAQDGRDGATADSVAVQGRAGGQTHLGEMPAVYNAAAVGTTGYGVAQASGVPPFPTRDEPAGSAREPATSGPTFTPSDTKYMEVRHAGLLHPRAGALYIPYTAVSSIDGETVTLACTAEEAAARYAERPAPLAGAEG